MRTAIAFWLLFTAASTVVYGQSGGSPALRLDWAALPALPDELGVAGAAVGVHNDALLVAGGTDFPRPHWDNDKRWRADVWVLNRTSAGGCQWLSGFELQRPIAYGACVSTSQGIVCLGGNDSQQTFDGGFLLRWDPSAQRVEQIPLPGLPEPCAFAAAAAIDDTVYLAGDQSGASLDTAAKRFWRLDLSQRGGESFAWRVLPAWPGPPRAYHLAVAQNCGSDRCVYVFSGRRQDPACESDRAEPLLDMYEFNPARLREEDADPRSPDHHPQAEAWRRRADLPRAVMAGTAVAVGRSQLVVLSGDDGGLLGRAEQLKLAHPGFPRRVLAYDTLTDTWTDAGSSPANQVSNPAVWWGDKIVLAAGEIKPRVRTNAVWAIQPHRGPAPRTISP